MIINDKIYMQVTKHLLPIKLAMEGTDHTIDIHHL